LKQFAVYLNDGGRKKHGSFEQYRAALTTRPGERIVGGTENVKSALQDVDHEYEELTEATDAYGSQMAVAALGIALQELHNALDAALSHSPEPTA
jgi:hypothetical protein